MIWTEEKSYRIALNLSNETRSEVISEGQSLSGNWEFRL